MITSYSMLYNTTSVCDIIRYTLMPEFRQPLTIVIYIYIYVYTFSSLSLYIYICVGIYVYVYIYIYIYAAYIYIYVMHIPPTSYTRRRWKAIRWIRPLLAPPRRVFKRGVADNHPPPPYHPYNNYICMYI